MYICLVPGISADRGCVDGSLNCITHNVKAFATFVIVVLAVILTPDFTEAQLIVTPGNTISLTPEQFVQTYLVGSGITVSNVTFNGSSNPINTIQSAINSLENQQIGYFTTSGTTTGELTFTGGVILASGKVTSASAPPTYASDKMHGPRGDPDLALIANATLPSHVEDEAIIEFDFVPQTDVINFNYRFASEEWDTYCYSYNDVFGFFLSGPGISGGAGFTYDAVNLAVLPGTSLPVTINNVCDNKTAFSWWNVPEGDLAYNRFTLLFSASYSVQCQQTYHIKIALCDIDDENLDSGVFLEQNSMSSPGVQFTTSFTNPAAGQNAIPGCNDAILQFNIPHALPDDYVIGLGIAATSTAPQADFLPNPLQSSIIIPAGATQSAPLQITPVNISQAGGSETLILDAAHTACSFTSVTQPSIGMLAKLPLVASITPPPPTLICEGDHVSLSATVSGGIPAYSYLWPGGKTTNPASITASASNPTVSLTVTDVCSDVANTSLLLNVTPLPSAPGPVTGLTGICKPQNGVIYHIDPVPGATSYNWLAPAGVTYPSPPASNQVSMDFSVAAVSGLIQVSCTNACGSSTTSSLNVSVNLAPLPTLQSGSAQVCAGVPVTYTTESGMNTYTWVYPAASATVVSGGGSNDNVLTLKWTSAGSWQVSVNYTSAPGCTGVSPASVTTMVSALPVASITGTPSACLGSQGVVYSTDPLQSNYVWTVSPGNTVTPNQNTCSVNWQVAGSQWVKVMYQDPLTGCETLPGTELAVNVNPLPVPTINASHSLTNGICIGQTGSYMTEAGMSGYVWTITPGGTITVENGENLQVLWTVSGLQSVGVNYINPQGCAPLGPANISFNVNPLPDLTITGPLPAVACSGQTSTFSVPADPGTIYTWSVSPSSAGNLTSPQGLPDAVFSWMNLITNVRIDVIALSSHNCSNANHTFSSVKLSPDVSLDLCIDPVTIPSAKPYLLKGGHPAGVSGSYSGEGVSLAGGQYIFDPSAVAGPFPKQVNISYAYMNMYGFSSQGIKTVTIVDVPSFQCGSSSLTLKDVRTTPYRSYSTYFKGNRCWMTMNLDYGTAMNSQQIQSDNCIPEKYCSPADPSCSQYGGLYQWDELMQYTTAESSQGLCMPGWHVPSLNEWQMLLDDPSNKGNSLAGGYLKDIPFLASLNGFLYLNNTWKFYPGSDLTAVMYWTSTLLSIDRAWARGINNENYSVSLYSSSRANAFTIRCVRD